jgi:pyruvate dehydrogenase E1 component
MEQDLSTAVTEGAYWLREPVPGSDLAVIAMGAVLPEAIASLAQIGEYTARAGLLVVTSPDRLHHGWMTQSKHSHAAKLLAPLASDARLVTVLDGHPLTLSWLGAVRGQRCAPLGVEKFGQSGDLPDLYSAYGIDTETVVTRAFTLDGTFVNSAEA